MERTQQKHYSSEDEEDSMDNSQNIVTRNKNADDGDFDYDDDDQVMED